jgi:hypothetical protein
MATAAQRRRTTDSTSDGTPRRSRRPRASGTDLLATLAEQVEQLIKENRQLKRALATAEKVQGPGAGLGQAAKVLSGLERRIGRALTAATTGGRRRASSATPSTRRPRRKVTDPEVLERRRASLAKARAARAAKREAAGR